MNVAVCGMPRSGNRLVQRLLQRHGFVAEVRHFGDRKVLRTGGGPEAAIMPLRDLEPHWASCAKDFGILPKPPQGLDDIDDLSPAAARSCLHAAHFWPALAHLAELGIPVLPVRYEELVAEPEAQGRRILEFLGCFDWRGWGEELFDSNAKWEANKSTAPGVHGVLELQGALERGEVMPVDPGPTLRALSRCVRYLESIGLGDRGSSAAGEGRRVLELAGYDFEADRWGE